MNILDKQQTTNTSFKNITYTLFGIIFLMLILLSYAFYKSLKNNSNTDNLIVNFKEKFRKDSIRLVKKNQVWLDNQSQKIKDSIVKTYEDKFKIRNKNVLDLNTNNHENKKLQPTKNLTNSTLNTHSKTKKNASNVTSYSKLNLHSKKLKFLKPGHYTSNVTLYSKLESKNTITKPKSKTFTSNVTSYSKLKNTNLKTTQKTSNVTTYSKLKNTKKTTTTTKLVKKPKVVVRYQNTENPIKNSLAINNGNTNLTYANSTLNSAVNFHDVEISPIYPGCENKNSENDKKNCFATKIANHVIRNFSSKGFQKSNLKKSYNNIRILLIVDNQGYSKVGKIVGNWPRNVKTEVNRVINSIPKIKPGKHNNHYTSVKYSFKIPFTVK